MKKILISSIIIFIAFTELYSQDTLIIQENELGQCTMDGVVETSTGGWTGTGYINANSGIGTTISWEIFVPEEGIYSLTWRYAFGGTPTNLRDGKLVIDGNVAVDTVYFPYTGAWTTWEKITPVNVNLTAGDHKIRLEAVRSSGLANIDYFAVIDSTVTAMTCTPQYTVNVASDSSTWGSVWFTPVKTYYDKGTIVTIHANPNPGYIFQCWMGEETSADSVYTFAIKGNVNDVARFLPNTIRPDSSAIGYASVEDDKGTPYWVFGGALGDTVTAYTLSDLQTYLGDSFPRVVKFSGELTDNAEISIKSNKTLLGVGTAHLHGIELSINQSQNVIVRNMTISKVRDTLNTNDAFEINGGSKNILIDHCELYSDRDHDKDYYDGLLDIKNGSSFITVSWTRLHDHYKACLISSGPEQYIDTVARLTFHHNYFYNIGSRLPSIRFGKAHIYNNYYKDCDDAVHSRIGACVRVEGNYFDNVGNAVDNSDTSGIGYVQLIDNHFGSSSYVTTPECILDVPYAYALDPTDSIPSIVANGVIPTDVEEYASSQFPGKFALDQNYPNPFNPSTTISFSIGTYGHTSLRIYDILGRDVASLVNEEKSPGRYILEWNAANMPSGVYFYRINAGGFTRIRKMLLLK